MVSNSKDLHDPKSVQIHYHLIRNVTSPEEKDQSVQTYVAVVPAFEIDKLNTTKNLRDYIAEYSARKRNSVHRAIENTIRTEPDRFINRNSGLTVACSEIEVQDDKKFMFLRDASLINGAQTQGEIRRFMEEITDPETGEVPKEVPFHIRLEVNVDPSAPSVVETAIARNTATSIASISQAGARGHLEDLRKSITKAQHGAKIRMSETDQGVLETLQILQFTRLLMPRSVSGTNMAVEKLRAYKNKAQCLADFSAWYMEKNNDETARQKYEYTVQIAPHAIAEYEYWQGHSSWNGHQIWEDTKKGRAVRRDKAKQIIWVSPGIIFPLLSALSDFVVKDSEKGWVIEKPDLFSPDEMVTRAVSQFRAHDSNPMNMGRSEAAYDALRIYPETLMQVIKATAIDKIVASNEAT